MILVVADTNIFISAVMFGGLPGIFLELAFRRTFLLVTSPVLLDEPEDKLRANFGMPAADGDMIRARLESTAQMVEPGIRLMVIKENPDNDRVLECAVAGRPITW